MSAGKEDDPLALRALKDELARLFKEETEVSDRISRIGRDIRKKRREKLELQEAVDRTRESYKRLSTALVVSLPEYWQLRLLMPTQERCLVKLSEEIETKQKLGEAAGVRLEQIRKRQEVIQNEIVSWNQIIEFKKRRGR